MFDILIRGGLLADGGGAPPRRVDVGIVGDTVAEVGQLPQAAAGVVIEAGSLLVLPGFVDAHVHADAAVFDPQVQLALLSQGVTTVLLGQDGMSFAPSGPDTLAYAGRYFAAVNGSHPAAWPDGVTVAQLLAGYHHRVPVNTAYLVPHGTVRHQVMGADPGPASPDRLAAMRRLVEQGLADGAVGLSSGLEYVPGAAADADELARLTVPLADAGLPYVSHLRGYEDRIGIGLAEAVRIARLGGARLHVSHLHAPAATTTALLDDAVAQGVDLSFDSYPYLRGSSILAMVALPPWLHTADLDATVRALSDPAVLRRLDDEWFPRQADLWGRIVLSHLPTDGWRQAEGRSLPVAAEAAGLGVGALVCRLLVDTDLAAGCVFGHPPAADEASLRTLLRHPAQLAGSDGIYQGGRPHPRGWGAFARLLGRHVRELGDWTWGQAAVHLSARAAERFRLPGRGRVEPGRVADLVVLDPATVTDRAWYDDPRRTADGVRHVLVAGVPVLADGALTTAALHRPPGRALTAR